MEVTTIDVTKEQAEAKLQQYMSTQRKKLTEMDHTLYKGYQSIAAGLPVIDINDAIKAGGVFEDIWAPKIAIARADLKDIYFSPTFSQGDRTGEFTGYRDHDDFVRMFKAARLPEGTGGHQWSIDTKIKITLPPGTLPYPMINANTNAFRSTKHALVPEIPLEYRPQNPSEFLLLWEVERWEPVAPIDPLLLEEIAHPLYVVVAQWDLTALEQKILESFRTRR